MTKKEIETMRNELDTQLKFANALLDELRPMLGRKLTPAESKRAEEIKEIMVGKLAWIKKAKSEIGAFYTPSTLVG